MIKLREILWGLFACNLHEASVIPALQFEAFSEMFLVLVRTGYQAAWPLHACPALPLTPVLHSHLICSFSPLHFCTRLTPAWPTPTNPPSISNVKLYELLPPTLHTGQAVRGPYLCFQRQLPLLSWFVFKSVILCQLWAPSEVFIFIFPPLQNGEKNCTYVTEWLWGLNEIMYIKHLA